MNKKKVLITALTIINTCIIVIWIIYLVNSQIYSRKHIRELFESNSNCRNYIININYTDYINEDFSYQKTITCKDNICKEHSEETTWYTKNRLIAEGPKVIIYNDEPGYIIFTLTNLQNMEMYINNSSFKYRFVKLEKYNGKQCIVVEFEREEEQSSELEYEDKTQKHRFWIDKETGVILKQIEFNKYSEILREYEYTVEMNCVTDSDVILPDTDGYEVIDQKED